MPNHNDEPLLARVGEAELPRGVQIPVGIVLGLFTLLCAFVTVDIFLLSGKKTGPRPILAVAVVLILLLACLWVLGKCVGLVTGRKKRGGLMSPNALRVVAIFTADYAGGGSIYWVLPRNGGARNFQAVMYVFGFFRLRALARKREAAPTGRVESMEAEGRPDEESSDDLS